MQRYIRITILFSFIGFLTLQLNAQVSVKGNLHLKEKKSSKSSYLKIEKNSEIVDRIELGRKGNFKYKLALNNEYLLHFTNEGYVTKKIEVNTNVPSGKESKSFQPLYFEVELFKSVPNSELGPFKYPVGKIVYNSSIEEFDYDVDYSRTIQNKLRKKEKAYKKARDKYEKQQRQKKIAQKREKLKEEREQERKQKQAFIQKQKKKAKERKEKLEEQQEKEQKKKQELKERLEERAKERADSIAQVKAKQRREEQEKIEEQQEKLQEKAEKERQEEIKEKKERLDEIEETVEQNKKKAKKEKQEELEKKRNVKEKVKKQAKETREKRQKRKRLSEQEKKELIENNIRNAKKEYLREIFQKDDNLGSKEGETDAGSYREKAQNLDFYRKVDRYEKYGMQIKRIILKEEDKLNVYHKVKHNWGGVFFFKDYRNIGKHQFILETSKD
jgi:DNA polymerase III alpha subunit (gram-positive type)